MLLKNICGENSHLFANLRFRASARVFLCRLVLLVLFVLFVLLVRAKSFRKKKKKKFETALITSFILLLRS